MAKQTIISCSSRLLAQKISTEINRQKDNPQFSQSLCVHNTRQEKEAFIQYFNNTNLQVLVGVDYLLEIDLHNVDNIILLRRFGSADFVLQSISRFLRLQKNSAPLRILDFVNNDWSLLSKTTPVKEYIADINGSSSNKGKDKKSVIFSKTQLLFATKN